LLSGISASQLSAMSLAVLFQHKSNFSVVQTIHWGSLEPSNQILTKAFIFDNEKDEEVKKSKVEEGKLLQKPPSRLLGLLATVIPTCQSTTLYTNRNN
jgi:hypothetical protein